MEKPDPGTPASSPGVQGIRRIAAFATRRRANNPFVNFEHPNSLFGEILDWMLAPLLLLWPISIAATNHVAGLISNQPYDQHLVDKVTAIVSMSLDELLAAITRQGVFRANGLLDHLGQMY